MQAHHFAQAAPDPVARHRVSQFPGHRKAHAVFLPPVFPAVDHRPGADRALSAGIDSSEIAVLFQAGLRIHPVHSHSGGKCQKGGLRRPVLSADRRFHPVFFRPESGAESGSAFRSAAGKNLAAVGGAHSLAETVFLAALALFGLIRTKHCLHSFHNDTQQSPPSRKPAGSVPAEKVVDK